MNTLQIILVVILIAIFIGFLVSYHLSVCLKLKKANEQNVKLIATNSKYRDKYYSAKQVIKGLVDEALTISNTIKPNTFPFVAYNRDTNESIPLEALRFKKGLKDEVLVYINGTVKPVECAILIEDKNCISRESFDRYKKLQSYIGNKTYTDLDTAIDELKKKILMDNVTEIL